MTPKQLKQTNYKMFTSPGDLLRRGRRVDGALFGRRCGAEAAPLAPGVYADIGRLRRGVKYGRISSSPLRPLSACDLKPFTINVLNLDALDTGTSY